MFVGHFALGFAAKRVAPRTSLGTLLAAAQALDLLWPALVLAGVERVRIAPGATAFTPLDFESYPWSHSLLMAAVWALLCGGLYFALRRSWRGALVVGGLVASHWLLDLLTHRPDLPLAPGGGPLYGLGLWYSIAGTYLVELGLFAVGVTVYAAGSRPRDRVGVWALWSLVGLLLLVYLPGPFAPPPPSAPAIAGAGLGIWLFVFWGAWIDRHRDWTWR
ncbi:MAG: metal-dependent hydrolase [Acidobacteriota bacterium]